MAKAIVFEGCPACKGAGYSYGAPITLPDHVVATLKGGGIGAGSVIAADMLLTKIFPIMSPMTRIILGGGVVLGASYMLKDRYPEIATGIAIGGGAIILYKFIGLLTGKVLAVTRPTAAATPAGTTAGLGAVTAQPEVEIEEKPEYGVIVPEVEYGQEEIFVE